MTLRQLYDSNGGQLLKNISSVSIVATKKLPGYSGIAFKCVNKIKKSSHIVEIHYKLDGKIIQETIRQKKPIALANVDITIACSCPSFQYWGPSYNLSKRNAKYGEMELIPPDERDPHRHNLICKHIAKVYQEYGKLALYQL